MDCLVLVILESSTATLKDTVSGEVRGMKLERHFRLAECNYLLEIYPGHLLLTRSVGVKDFNYPKQRVCGFTSQWKESSSWSKAL